MTPRWQFACEQKNCISHRNLRFRLFTSNLEKALAAPKVSESLTDP